MLRYKRITRSGAVLEQEVYDIAPNTKNLQKWEPKPINVRTHDEKEEYNRKKSLKRFVRIVNTNFSPKSFYVTLTYDNKQLPEDITDAKRDLDNYMRRLRYLFPAMVAVAVTGRGKRSGRIHFHLIISGIDRETILQKWTQGSVKRAEPLRQHNYYNGIDHGADYTGLAIYLFNHWTEEQGGKRWKQTKTIQQPGRDKPQKIKRRYSLKKPPITPKGYMLVEKRKSAFYSSGYLYFKYVRIADHQTDENNRMLC